MSTFQHLSSPGTKATHLALQQAWLRVLSGRKPLKHCKVNFWHPGYCVCPKPLTRTAFLLNCKTQKKNSEGLEQNWHLHSHMFIFYTCFPCHSSIECWYQIPNFTSSNQKRQETSHVMSETKCWASVPLPTMVDPTENVVLVCLEPGAEAQCRASPSKWQGKSWGSVWTKPALLLDVLSTRQACYCWLANFDCETQPSFVWRVTCYKLKARVSVGDRVLLRIVPCCSSVRSLKQLSNRQSPGALWQYPEMETNQRPNGWQVVN